MNPSAPWSRQIGAFVVGYLIACVAAAMAYTFFVALSAQIIGVAEPSDYDLPGHIRMLVGFTIFVGLFVVTTSFLPTIAAVVLLSLVGLRDIVSYMVAGAAVSAAAVEITARYVPLMNNLTLNWGIAAAGAVGGAAFWFVATRLTAGHQPTA